MTRNSNKNIETPSTIQRYCTDTQKGLTTEQLNERIAHNLVNVPPVPLSKTVPQIIFQNVFTFFNFIFFALAFLVVLVGDFRSLTFLPVIIINMLVGIIQEIRSKNALEKLTMLKAPKTTVIRNGKEELVLSETLVLDDIVVFASGNQIPADALVTEGEVQVNEALLTGEADEITKKVGDYLYSGSFIVSGKCKARLDKVGNESGISKLTMEAKALKGVGKSKMMLELNKLLKIVGFIIVPLGVVLFLNARLRLHLDMVHSVNSMVAALIGMIPEGLYLLTTMALVLSMMRLAKDNVLVHEMNCIEMLARVDVLCVDKTGTITEPDMAVFDYIAHGDTKKEHLYALLSNFAHAMQSDNPTMEALKAYFKTDTHQTPLSFSSFSSQFKYSSVTFKEGCYLVGAPEFVLRDDYVKHQQLFHQYEEKGYRTLAVAKYLGTATGKQLTEKAELSGIILLKNPVRASAKQTFEYFDKQGVQIKVISGDNPLTVSRVAMEAGVKGAENYIDATTLLTEEDALSALQKYTVFGRVVPAQKRMFVNLLKRIGHTVAMTGDGVNDVLALKDADCSVAMASGSDAAAQCAQLVLMDSDFKRMPEVVNEGRRVVNNIERSASLFLVKNIFSFVMALASILFTFRYPITPAQMSLISSFTIGIPAFFLALEKNHNRITGNFLQSVSFKALPAALTDIVLIGVLVRISKLRAFPIEQTATATFILMAVVGMLIIYSISKPMNTYRITILCTMIAGLTLCAVFLNNLFRTVRIPLNNLVFVLILSAAALPLMIFFTKVLEYLKNKKNRPHHSADVE